MKVLLSGSFEADEAQDWQIALAAACPGVVWLDAAQARAAARTSAPAARWWPTRRPAACRACRGWR